MKKFNVILAFCLCLCFMLSGCKANNVAPEKLKITASCISAYDFVAAVAGDLATVDLILPPGSDLHSFEPTAKNIVDIANSNLFIFIGGESENWVNKILESVSTQNSLKIADFLTETHSHSHDHHHSHPDEHFWTSPENAIIMVEQIKNKLCQIDNINSAIYEANANNYINKINEEAQKTKDIVENSRLKTLIVPDRFPYEYFAEYYGLDHISAFSGCAKDTDADLLTVTNLINSVKENKAKAVFVTELSSGFLANTVAENTGAKVIELHSFHNISINDFNNNVTYLDIMVRNRQALKEGLN